MKHFPLVIFISVLAFSRLYGNVPFSEFKVGYQDPEDARAGYIFGLNVGRMIDESLSWSFEFNYFQKSYTRVTTLGEVQLNDITPEIKQKELEYKTYMIPLFLKLNWENQLGYRSPFFLRASGGLGWEMVWNNENNYITDVHSTRFYHGFGWQGALGIGIQISSSANFFLDGIYNGSKVTRNDSTNEEGFPTWEELDISGFGLRVGISILGFGW
ncbi:MAG: hypothetical protein EH225_10825 [Calditrichaeota bacterium]|nr:outer membrane beta-barrel protein [Calditrichota bacterium]RQV92609.1 MAG: hypothetical protein EH221_11010 [bacterium]RQV99841.1 MAG: hypothetical protein EH225_10825 [Calditrichota bacterium]